MLDQRKATILRAIVAEFVRSGQPVGSKLLTERYGLEVSPATVRNDMALLEDLGYIHRPHSSAGRVPTDLGYRWFVDHWPGPAWPLSDRERRSIERALRAGFGGLDDVLDLTSHVLSEATEAASVVATPPSRTNRLRRLELLFRDERRATLLLIADTGVVEQGLVELAEPRTEDHVSQVARGLDAELHGLVFEDLAGRIRSGRPDPDRARIADEVEHIVRAKAGERVFRGGTANILGPDKFPDIATAHEVVDALEHPRILSALFEVARRSQSILVLIGAENPVREMRVCAAVFASYDLGEGRRGTLGVIGPTRMDYPHTISVVEAVARSLSGVLYSYGV